MSGNILFLGNKLFEIPPFFQTRPGDLGKKVRACSLRFSALNLVPRRVVADWYSRVTGAILASVFCTIAQNSQGPLRDTP